MQLTTYNPRRGLRTYNHGFNLFDEFFAPFNQIAETPAASLSPAVDISEKDGQILIEADLPGLEKEDIKVDIDGRLLTLSGERSSEDESNKDGRYRRERRYGRFSRTFKLPFAISEEQVNASYKNGVLKLVLEKPEEQKPKKITVN